MEQFVFPCLRVAVPPLGPAVEVPVVAATCVLKEGSHRELVVRVAGALKSYDLRIESIFLPHLRARPGGHDVVHTATPAEPAVRSPLPIATGLSIDANAWCQAVKPPAPWSEYGAEPQQVVGGGGVRGGGMSMPPTT